MPDRAVSEQETAPVGCLWGQFIEGLMIESVFGLRFSVGPDLDAVLAKGPEDRRCADAQGSRYLRRTLAGRITLRCRRTQGGPRSGLYLRHIWHRVSVFGVDHGPGRS